MSNLFEAVKREGLNCISFATVLVNRSDLDRNAANIPAKVKTSEKMPGLWVSRKKLLAEPKLLGAWGERRCERFLRRKGFTTIVRNFSCKAGEIDLVMSGADCGVVFVEVKTRADEAFSDAESSITSAKKTRLIRAAKYFVQTHNVDENIPMRFDVVIVVLGKKGKGKIRHYENAFVP